MLDESVLRRLLVHFGLSDADNEPLSNDMARRLRRNQIRGAIEQMRVFVISNTIFAPILSFQAWNTGVNWLVISWTASMLCFSWWLIVRWQTSYHTNGSIEDMAKFVAETRLNSTIWCMGMVLLYPYVEGDQKAILTTVMAGSLALGTVGFSHAPRAAGWYLLIQASTLTLVPFTYGITRGTGSDLMIAALALFAGLAIGNTVLERARAQMRAFRNTEALQQKTEIVELLLKDYAEQGVEWIWKTDRYGKMFACPEQIKDLMQITRDTNGGIDLLTAIARVIDKSGADQLSKVTSAFSQEAEFHDVILPIRGSETEPLNWIMMRGRPQFEGDVFIGFRGIFADATVTVEAQKQVEFLAKRDPLTGIYNRTEIQSKLSNLSPRTQAGTVYLIDLDGFKQVNDSYGHSVGDKLLQQVANRLTGAVADRGMTARLGGDEFLIYTDDGSRFELSEGTDLCNQVLLALSAPFIIGQYDIALSASIGTARFPVDTPHGDSLLHFADLALYEAKRGGRNQHIAFQDSMQEGLQQRILVTERLRSAIKEDLIVPHFQPQHCTQTEQLIGFEALARWEDPELGVVGPDIFIPIAEETGLIHKIGRSILWSACNAAQEWSCQDPTFKPTIAVNVSPIQVTRGDIVKVVKDVLSETGLPPNQLEIEVTEGVLIDDIEGTSRIFRELSEMGVKIALDDFGTGYSSLSYLRALPLDRLKIDRSFISGMEEDEGRSVVQAIIDLCRRLDLEVIAEGVETLAHVEALREMGCDLLQGYHLSPALRFEEVSNGLAASKTSVA